MTQRTSRRIEIATALLLTVCFVLAAGSVLGLAMSDDSSYMQGSTLFKFSAFGKFREWGPLYSLWFGILSVPCRNPISRYFLSWGLLVAALALLPTWLKTRSAWLYTLIVLALPVFTIWPFVSLFAAVIILYSLCLLLQRERSILMGAAIACGVCFVLSFVRPEFGYGVFAGAMATIAIFAVERLRSKSVPFSHPTRDALLWIAVCILLCAVTLFLQIRFPNPVPRSGMAFAQHFTLRAAKRGLIVGDSSNWQSDYAERQFGIDPGHNSTNGSASITDFLHANPRLFAGHLFRNLTDPVMVGCTLVLLCVLLWPWLRRDARHLRAASIFLAVIAVPTAAAMILIYPRAHYAITMFPAVTILALRLVDPPAWQIRFAPWVIGLGCGSIWLFNIGAVLRSNGPATPDMTTLRRIQCEHAVDLTVPPGNLWVFAADAPYPIYLPRTRAVATPDFLPTWSALQRWATQTRPAWISTDAELAKRYGVKPNELDLFIKGQLGYTPHPCPLDAQLTVYTNDAP